MSRTVAATDPFRATALSRMKPGPASVVRGLHALVRRSPLLASVVWMGSGYRTGSVEHARGCAIDIIIVEEVGRRPSVEERLAALALVDWLIAHASQLGILGIIFSRDGKDRPEIWGYSAPGQWRAFPPRGSVSGDHIDHVHVLMRESASWPASLDTAVVGPAGPQSPGVPSTGVSEPDWDGKSFPGRLAFRLGQRHAAVTLLGQRLVAHGYGSHYKVGPGPEFGPADVAATRAFQRAQGWSGPDADGYPGPETWRRLMAAPSKPAKPAKVVSLAQLVAAAKRDPARPQGGTTAGSADDVRIVEAALMKEGLLPSKWASDGSFGSSTVAAYRRWQQRLGYRGRDADGIPGRASLVELGRRHGFTVA